MRGNKVWPVAVVGIIVWRSEMSLTAGVGGGGLRKERTGGGVLVADSMCRCVLARCTEYKSSLTRKWVTYKPFSPFYMLYSIGTSDLAATAVAVALLTRWLRLPSTTLSLQQLQRKEAKRERERMGEQREHTHRERQRESFSFSFHSSTSTQSFKSFFNWQKCTIVWPVNLSTGCRRQRHWRTGQDKCGPFVSMPSPNLLLVVSMAAPKHNTHFLYLFFFSFSFSICICPFSLSPLPGTPWKSQLSPSFSWLSWRTDFTDF